MGCTSAHGPHKRRNTKRPRGAMPTISRLSLVAAGMRGWPRPPSPPPPPNNEAWGAQRGFGPSTPSGRGRGALETSVEGHALQTPEGMRTNCNAWHCPNWLAYFRRAIRPWTQALGRLPLWGPVRPHLPLSKGRRRAQGADLPRLLLSKIADKLRCRPEPMGVANYCNSPRDTNLARTDIRQWAQALARQGGRRATPMFDSPAPCFAPRAINSSNARLTRSRKSSDGGGIAPRSAPAATCPAVRERR